MDEQRRVAEFLATHDLETDAASHALDLAAEVGEVAAAVNESTDYESSPETVAVPTDELGDALFALLATCERLDVDAGVALEESLAKYERRLDATGDPGSGATETE
ncbi:MazG nucleotide pyrophosphohydrolase domain-containing protein [Halobaculum sp. MBLA0147]|uniref:MazG nucleotide pyrophosphohydrolase domain-containing protein n=1 Tax=Halobaculum sp. MBLA0147 TaxID=3079934 RepID=UPI0035252FD3